MISWEDFVATLQFSLPALAATAALGVAAATLGVFVLLKRHTLAALAYPQAVAVGIALGLRLAWPTLLPAVVLAALAVVLVGSLRSSASVDALLASIYVGCMCACILLIANAAQHLTDIQHMLVGYDVLIDEQTVYWLVPLLLGATIITGALWRRWLLLAQSPAVAEIAGVHPRLHAYAFHALLAGVVLLGTQALGVVMVLVMLFLPASAAIPLARRVPGAIVLSILLAILSLAAGFVLSVLMDWPLSHSVGGVGLAAVVVCRIVARVMR